MVSAYQSFVKSEMSGFRGTRQQMNLKMREVGARWKAHKSGAGVRGRGLQSDIKSALANVDLNQLKNIDYSKAGSYITGKGVRKTRGRGLQSDIKSALANVDLNQLKNIDYSKTGQYITGSGIKRRGRGVSGEGLKVVKRTNNVLRRKNNVVRKSGRGFMGSMLGNLVGGLIGQATGNRERGSAIGQSAGAFLPF
jgi:hypothetical protein